MRRILIWVLMIAAANGAWAANGTWSGLLNNIWATTNNWGSTNAVPGSGNTATFNNAGSGNTTLDLGAGVTIATLLFDTANAAAYTIGSGAVGSQMLALNDSGAITLNSTVANNQLVNANLLLGTATGPFSYGINQNAPAATLTLAGSVQGGSSGLGGAKTLMITGAGNTTISGIIANGGASSVSLSKSGVGILVMTNANTYSGNTTAGGGVLRADYGAGLPSATGVLYLQGNGVLETTGTIARTLGTGAGNISFSGSGGFAARGGALGVTLNGGGTLTMGSTASFLAQGTSLVLGSASDDSVVTFNHTLDYTGNPASNWGGLNVVHNTSIPLTQDKAILNGGIKFTGGNSGSNNGWQKYGSGRIEVTGASASSSSINFLISGGVLALTGSGALDTYRGVWVGGGDFEITGGNAANTAKGINILGISNGSDLSGNGGVIAAYGGPAIVTVVPGSGYAAKLTAASVGRLVGGTVLFRGTSLGTATNPIPNVANVFVTDSTQLYLTGDASNVNTRRKIVPYAMGDISATGFGTDFVTYNTTNGIRLLTAGEYDNAITDGQTTTNNVSITSVQTLNSSTLVNALRLDNGGGVTGSGTLTLNSGAILALAGNSGISVGTLAFGTREAVFMTPLNSASPVSLTVSSALTGSGGLTWSGLGTLTLPGSNGITGTSTVNAGTLIAGAANVFGSGQLKLQPGAVADMAGFDQTLAALTGATSGIFTNSGALATLTINASADTTMGPTLFGNVNLVKTGTATFAATPSQLANTGSLTVKAGTFQVNFVNNNGTIGRAITLDGGTILYYSLVSNQNSGNEHTFGDNVVVNASGGVISLDTVTGFNPISGGRLTGTVTMNGSLVLTNGPVNKGVGMQWALNNLTVNGTRTIYNNSPATAQYTATLPPAIAGGVTANLTLASGTGAGFQINSATASSLNLGGLTINAGTALQMNTGSADPFAQIKTNGGITTVYGTLSFKGNGQSITPMNYSFQAGSQMNLFNLGSDTSYTISSNLTVDSTGLTTLYYEPFRGGVTVTSPYILTIGNGGLFSIAVAKSDGTETTSANLKLLNGSVLQGYNASTYAGGLIRTAGTLTLGDGTPSVITIRGNHAAQTNTFNLGYSANVTDNGNVRIKYANTSATAGSYFNVGWSAGGSTTAALVPLKETSGGTEFTPLAGSGGVAIVGPGSGTVATFTNTTTLSTGGAVGFYNCGANNNRGSLGAVVVTNTGIFTITNLAGSVQTRDLTISGGTIGGIGTFTATNNLTLTNNATYQVWLYGSASNQCGLLAVSNALYIASGTTLVVAPTNGFSPSANQYWNIARAPSISGVPSAPPGYSVEVQGNYLKLTKLDSSGYEPAIANVNPTNVQYTAAFLNGNLMSTGMAPVTVSVFWGTADGGSNAVGSTWANTNTFTGSQPQGHLSTNVALAPDTYYYYRYYATNSYGDFMARPVQSFITGDINIQAVMNADEVGPVTGLFSVARAAALTNEDLTVNYAVSGTASNGVDYASLNGTVLIPRGATNATIAVAAIPDVLVEGTEYVTLTLLPGSYVVGTSPTATVSIADYPSKNLIWTDGSGSHKWNSADTNWTDGVNSQKYTDPDFVTFDNSASSRVINIVGTVQPAGTHFANTSGNTYQITNGTLGGVGALTVDGGGTVKLGLDGSEMVATLAPVMTYAGGTVISNNSLVKYSCGSSTPTNALGSGAVTFGGGRLHLNYSGNVDQKGMWLTNTLVTGALGGTLDLTPDGGGNNRRPSWTFAGGANLGGTLAVLWDGTSQGLVNSPTFSGVVALASDSTISNGTVNPGAAIYLSALSGAGRTLTLAGQSFVLAGTGGTAINVSNLNVNASLSITPGNGGIYNSQDYLSQLRANGGKVAMGSGKTLTLGAGQWHPADFAFGSNVTISPLLGGQGSQGTFTDNISIGTNANQASQIYWSLGQNEILGVASGKTLTIGLGGLLNLFSASMPATMDGNLRFTDGSRFNLTWTLNNSFSRSSGTLYLGDGNAATQETVRITGSMNADNSLNIFNLNYPSGNISDDGNVVLQYESNAGSAASSFNMSWAFGPFRGGSAGTTFMPAPGTLGIRAIGPAAPGTVFTVSNTVTVATAGTVGFYNSSGSSIDVQGPVVVTNGGTLAFSTNGTVLAGNTTFYAGSTQAVTMVGTATNAVGYLKVSGTLVFASGSKFVGSNPSGFKPAQGFWYVAEAATISGLPEARGGFGVALEPGTPQRLKVYPPLYGTVISVY